MNSFGIPFLSELMSQMRDLLYIILAKTEFLGTPDHVLGRTAFCVSLALFALYPLPTHLRIIRDKSTGGRQPYSHCFTSFACFLWMFYGMSTDHTYQGLCIVMVHLPSAIHQYYYMWIFHEHTTHRNKIIMEVTAILPEMLLVLMLPLWPLFLHRPHITGFVSAAFGIIMYASPIASIIDACMTRRTNYLPFGLCTMYFLNAVAWFAYSYLHTQTHDVFLAIAHGSGIILEIFMFLVSCIVLVIVKCRGTATEDSSLELMAPEDSILPLISRPC